MDETNLAYQNALNRAVDELKTLDEMAGTLERQRARLRQAIFTLQSLLDIPVDATQSLTDAILDIVKASSGYATASDVLTGMIARGYGTQLPTVATILSRMVKEKQLEKGPEGGYRWPGSGWTPAVKNAVLNALGSTTESPNTAREAHNRAKALINEHLKKN